MSLYGRASGSKNPTNAPQRVSEFDVLKTSHKFLRDDDETNLSWEDEMAKKYYSSLYREFAVCDLKHYKSGNFAIRWRTESEVLSGTGEETCANSRCTFHHPSRALPMPPLNTVELPFAYEEHGERKAALVKVVLCGKCLKKLMWKREKEKEEERKRREENVLGESGESARRDAIEHPDEGFGEVGRSTLNKRHSNPNHDRRYDHDAHQAGDGHDSGSKQRHRHKGDKRRRNSRSRSPGRKRKRDSGVEGNGDERHGKHQ